MSDKEYPASDDAAEKWFPLELAATSAAYRRSIFPVRDIFEIKVEASSNNITHAISLFERRVQELKDSKYTIKYSGGGGAAIIDGIILDGINESSSIRAGMKPLTEDDRIKLLERAVYGPRNIDVK